MSDVTRNLIDLAAGRALRMNTRREIADMLISILGTRFDELEALNLALLNRAGVQSEILTRLAEKVKS